MHLVLAGDSTFDNGVYVRPGEPAVIDQLREELPADAGASLVAVDGGVIGDVARQLAGRPESATHLFISVGGNDALARLGLLEQSVESVGAALLLLRREVRGFEREYGRMLDAAHATGLRLALCTVYFPRFAMEDRGRLAERGVEPVSNDRIALLQEAALGALSLFNEVIALAAARRGLPLIDLRLIFCDEADYANPIEPSAQGGQKLAACLARVAAAHDFDAARTVVYV